VYGRTTLPALALAAAGMLVASSTALGQAAVDQYIPSKSPAGHHKGHHGSSSGSGSAADGASAVAADQAVAGSHEGGAAKTGSGSPKVPVLKSNSASPGGGEVPGTSYPVTLFVAIAAGLVALVLAIRFLPPLARRLAGGPS
jgi:hypothetical protein